MFLLDISHLQAPTLTLPDALSTLVSHSVYMWIAYLLELLEKLITLFEQLWRGSQTSIDVWEPRVDVNSGICVTSDSATVLNRLDMSVLP